MYRWLLIRRYFLHKRIAWAAVAAVALLVMLVLVVLSIMSGLLADTRGRNHRWAGDIIISRDSLVGMAYYQEFIDEAKQLPEVETATPVIRLFGLEGEGRENTVLLYGVQMESFCRVTAFQNTLYFQNEKPQATFNVPPSIFPTAETLTPEQQKRGCIVGHYTLGQFTGVYQKDAVDRLQELSLRPEHHIPYDVTLFAIGAKGTLVGSLTGEYQKFWYVDTSLSGLVDIDATAMYVDFDELQRLAYMDGSDGGPPRANEIRLRLKPGIALQQGCRAVAGAWDDFVRRNSDQPQARLFEDVTVQTWQQFRRNQIAPAEKEKSLMVGVFAMIALVAVFIVFAIFYMIVTEKIRDLGIIRSVGSSGGSVAQIFLGYGVLVGFIGAVLGGTAGWLIVTNSNAIEAWLTLHFNFRLWDPDVYAIDRIPSTVPPVEAGIILIAAVLAAVLGAAWPARRAARLNVVDALRVE
ncbi:MAG: FtsX-like permease family protein [Sedimentisphaerales bacterium]|nr:FtsX-like permease family protein [Sedimentisphaerales bacterium]